MVLLLGTVIATTPVRSYAVDAKTQSTLFYTMAGLSLAMNFLSAGLAIKTGTMSINLDATSYILDALEISMYKKRKTHWSGIPEKLQAIQRLIGSFEELESYEESQAYVTETDVHAMALTTTGIEALYDDGNVDEESKQPAVVTSAAMTAAIQERFGTPELDDADASANVNIPQVNVDTTAIANAVNTAMGSVNASTSSDSSADSSNSSDSTESSSSTGSVDLTSLTSNLTETEAVDPKDTAQMQEKLREQYSEETIKLQRERRIINKQKMALTGVAKAELLQSVCATDNSKKRLSQLESYVGRGESLLGQTKILAGLELELGGRLNMLDAVQANTLAVDAAAALVHVK